MTYTVRRGLFHKPVSWRLGDGVLIETREGVEKVWPLSQLRAVRLVSGTNRYAPDERVLRLSFGRRGVSIGSHDYRGVGRYADQGEKFSDFVRDLCAQARLWAPAARFEGGIGKAAGLFTGAAAILAMGVVLLVVGAMAADQAALGMELAARFGFALILMFAAAPWLPGARARAFDPNAVPDDLLP